MRPMLHVPRHPLRLARFGLPAAMPATLLARKFRTEEARALWGGCAAHAFSPLSRPMSSSVGMALICAGHRYGWPVARGGSRAISDALAAVVREHGGKHRDRAAGAARCPSFPRADAVVLDLAPGAVAEIAGERLPGARRARLPSLPPRPGGLQGRPRRRRRACRGRTRPRAGRAPCTSAGSFAEIVAAEREINRGRMPERPFVLVCQQSLADPTRAKDDVHPVWAYAHVPHGYAGDATEALLDQIERFAPGLRERILATAVRSTSEIAQHNANYVGGDIITGANTPLADRDPPAPGARPLQHRHPRRLHLLRGDPSGGGRARDERLQRRALGAPRPGGVSPGNRSESLATAAIGAACLDTTCARP